jgi:NAD(P)-dependent dehydrogenase (short-subunit alcohol dehydrogenase family)
MGRLDGKVAIVTGGGGGFGSSTCRRFVAEGARVCIADVDEDRGRAVASDLGDAAFFVRCDHTSRTDAEAAVAQTIYRWGSVTTLFNNAGYVWTGKFDALDTAELQRILTVDLVGMAEMTRATLPALRSHAEAEPHAGAVILFMSSGLGLRGAPGTSGYAVAKHGVTGLMRSLAQELGPENIRVNSLAPGIADTAGMRAAWASPDEALRTFRDRTPLRRNVEAVDIANAALYLVSDEARNIHSVSFPVDGGIYGL